MKTGRTHCMGQGQKLQWRAGRKAISKLSWLGFVAKHEAYSVHFYHSGTRYAILVTMVSIQPQCPLRKEATLVLHSLHIFLRYLKTRTATLIFSRQIIMIWFLNCTIPDIKSPPVTQERLENKHLHRDAFCQGALNLLNVIGYDAPWQWMYCAILTQHQMVPSHH